MPLWLLPLVVWGIIFNIVADQTWGYGLQTFLLLIGAGGLLLLLPGLARALDGATRDPAPWQRYLLIAILLGLAGMTAIGVRDGFTTRKEWLVDIGVNTYLAGSAFLDGANPYSSRAQIVEEIAPGPNVEQRGDTLMMYGVPYRYGYPYYPAMFLGYLPWRALAGGFDSIRVGNLVFMLLNVAGIFLLMRRLVPHPLAPMIAVAAYLAIEAYPREIFEFGIVDIMISTAAVFAFLLLDRKKFLAAGILFGVAQACKLLPGPLLVLPALVWHYGRDGFRPLLGGYMAASLAIILPFLLIDPPAFLSATTLFYLTHHAAGDDTSLWFFLPSGLQTPFMLIGFLLAVAVAVVGLRGGRSTGDLVVRSFVSYLVVIAFGKMSHLNYLWGVYPLGCISLSYSWCPGALVVKIPNHQGTRTPRKDNG
jgi:hypothetical protein